MGSILVTGANGYIGRHVVKSLLDLGHKVYACDLRPYDFDGRALSVECNIFEDNIADKVGIDEIDACVHLAWRDGFVHNSSTHMKDLPKHYEFLTSLVDQGVKQLVVMGSMHEVGYHEGAIDENTPCNPMSLYAIAKDALRRALMLYCKDKSVLQWTRGYYITGDDGNSHSIFTKLLQADKEGKKEFPFTTGKNKYDFITVVKKVQKFPYYLSYDIHTTSHY